MALAQGELPAWVRVGSECQWWSKSQKTYHPIIVTTVDTMKRRIVVHFKENNKIWKTVPFSQMGPEGPMQPMASKFGASFTAIHHDVQAANQSGTATPPWYESLAPEIAESMKQVAPVATQSSAETAANAVQEDDGSDDGATTWYDKLREQHRTRREEEVGEDAESNPHSRPPTQPSTPQAATLPEPSAMPDLVLAAPPTTTVTEGPPPAGDGAEQVAANSAANASADHAWVQLATKTGQMYFWNRVHNSTGWVLPRGVQASWVGQKGPGGRTYYWNHKGETVWNLPPLTPMPAKVSTPCILTESASGVGAAAVPNSAALSSSIDKEAAEATEAPPPSNGPSDVAWRIAMQVVAVNSEPVAVAAEEDSTPQALAPTQPASADTILQTTVEPALAPEAPRVVTADAIDLTSECDPMPRGETAKVSSEQQVSEEAPTPFAAVVAPEPGAPEKASYAEAAVALDALEALVVGQAQTLWYRQLKKKGAAAFLWKQAVQKAGLTETKHPVEPDEFPLSGDMSSSAALPIFNNVVTALWVHIGKEAQQRWMDKAGMEPSKLESTETRDADGKPEHPMPVAECAPKAESVDICPIAVAPQQSGSEPLPAVVPSAEAKLPEVHSQAPEKAAAQQSQPEPLPLLLPPVEERTVPCNHVEEKADEQELLPPVLPPVDKQPEPCSRPEEAPCEDLPVLPPATDLPAPSSQPSEDAKEEELETLLPPLLPPPTQVVKEQPLPCDQPSVEDQEAEPETPLLREQLQLEVAMLRGELEAKARFKAARANSQSSPKTAALLAGEVPALPLADSTGSEAKSSTAVVEEPKVLKDAALQQSCLPTQSCKRPLPAPPPRVLQEQSHKKFLPSASQSSTPQSVQEKPAKTEPAQGHDKENAAAQNETMPAAAPNKAAAEAAQQLQDKCRKLMEDLKQKRPRSRPSKRRAAEADKEQQHAGSSATENHKATDSGSSKRGAEVSRAPLQSVQLEHNVFVDDAGVKDVPKDAKQRTSTEGRPASQEQKDKTRKTAAGSKDRKRDKENNSDKSKRKSENKSENKSEKKSEQELENTSKSKSDAKGGKKRSAAELLLLLDDKLKASKDCKKKDIKTRRRLTMTPLKRKGKETPLKKKSKAKPAGSPAASPAGSPAGDDLPPLRRRAAAAPEVPKAVAAPPVPTAVAAPEVVVKAVKSIYGGFYTVESPAVTKDVAQLRQAALAALGRSEEQPPAEQKEPSPQPARARSRQSKRAAPSAAFSRALAGLGVARAPKRTAVVDDSLASSQAPTASVVSENAPASGKGFPSTKTVRTSKLVLRPRSRSSQRKSAETREASPAATRSDKTEKGADALLGNFMASVMYGGPPGTWARSTQQPPGAWLGA